MDEPIVVSPTTYALLMAKAKEWDCTVEEAAMRLLQDYARVRED